MTLVRRPYRFHPIESLEPRRLLAGNIVVSVDANLVAHISGDNKNNEVEITSRPGEGYVVTGLRGTKINGSPAVLIRTTPALKFDILLGNGNDKVSFKGAFGTQDLNILTGNGKDIVSLSGGTHFGDITIDTGNADDHIILNGIHGTKNLTIRTDNGKDTLAVQSPIQIDGNVTIDGGSGKNSLTGSGALNASGVSAIERFNSGKGNQAKVKKAKDD